VLIGLLGGIGARSRRGFGSLAITGLVAGDEPVIAGLPGSVDDYKKLIDKHLGPRPVAALPPWSAFGADTVVRVVAKGGNHWQTLMNEIGWAFQIYRSWGQRKRPPDVGHTHKLQPADVSMDAGAAKAWYRPEFKADHEFKSNFDELDFDNRSLFGLPHNYGNVQIGWTDGGATSDIGRRASPLFMHFHRLAGGDHIAALMIVPAQFAPNGSRLHVDRGNRNVRPFPTPANWEILTGFGDFVVTPDPGAGGGDGGGVRHTSYTPITEGHVK